ncbi:unnamed protein product [Caenorhabditis angaria]|uniref:Serpentine receptor class r-10 n=1 Tax=Caenorhabditis angaria TaxID=860376 RepID=A0A9P1IY74_9PELO|nr:unnamed protein product [Caenorhabditis angaria]
MISSKNLVNTMQELSLITSILANILLMYLVYKKSPKQIGSYKYLMIYIAVFEMCYSILDVLLEPLVLSHTSLFFVIIHTKSTFFTKEICIYLISIWGAFFGSFMAFFAVQFIYRYFVVSGSIYLKTFNDWRLVLWMTVPLTGGVFWAFLTIFCLHPDKQTDDVIRNVVLETFDFEIKDISYVGSYLYRTINGREIIDWTSLTAIILMIIVMILSITTTTVFATKCFLEIKNYVKTAQNFSKKLKSLQNQLFYALVTQTLIPIILMHLPVTILIISTVLSIDLGQTSVLVSITIALFPALDPFPVILIVKHYRFAMMSAVSTPVVKFIRKRLDNPV